MKMQHQVRCQLNVLHRELLLKLSALDELDLSRRLLHWQEEVREDPLHVQIHSLSLLLLRIRLAKSVVLILLHLNAQSQEVVE